MGRPRDYELVRSKNRYLVLQALWNQAPVTREEIIALTGLSNPTVQAALHDFRDRGLLTEVNRRESTGGRPATELALNSEAVYALAAWLSVPTMRAGVIDLGGNLVATAECRLAREADAPAVLALLASTLRQAIESAGIRPEKICGIGIAVSGVLDGPARVSVSIERLEEWRNVPIGEYLDREFGLPVILMADTQSALAAELVLGMKRSARQAPPQSALFILIREGLGSSLILGGRLHDGPLGNAGFMGHMCLDPNGPSCYCGGRGCLETYVSELAITCEVGRRLAAGQPSSLRRAGDLSKLESVTIEEVAAAFRQGDQLVVRVVDTAADHLALGIANAIKLLQPEVVVLSAPSFYTDETILARIVATAQSHLAKMQTYQIKIIPAPVDSDAEIRGVGMIVLEQAVTNALELPDGNGLMEVVGLRALA